MLICFYSHFVAPKSVVAVNEDPLTDDEVPTSLKTGLLHTSVKYSVIHPIDAKANKRKPCPNPKLTIEQLEDQVDKIVATKWIPIASFVGLDKLIHV